MLKDFLHIIRLPNLLIIGLIQLLIYYRLIEQERSILSIGTVALLIFVTMVIAASGYVINDYYDAKTDSINRPHRWIAGNSWPLKQVLNTYLILIVIGAVLAMALAIQLSLLPYLFLYPLAVLGLWYYSYALKCFPVVGNLWVSLFCGGVIIILAAPDLLLDKAEVIRVELWYYAAFACLATWYREIVKDLEDIAGDTAVACKTFVVRHGIQKGKIMAGLIALWLLIALVLWENSYTDNTHKLVLTVLEGSIVASFAFTWWAKDSLSFHRASLMAKGIMLAGTLFLLLI